MHESTPPKQIMLHERQGWASSRCVTPLVVYCHHHLSFPYNTIIPQIRNIYTSLSPKQIVSVEPGDCIHGEVLGKNTIILSDQI